VTKDEVPEGWGLVTCTEDGVLKTMKMPLQRTPAPWDMPFIASLLRKASEPASEVPLKMWKVAGKDLTMDELKELFVSEMESIKRAASREATASAKLLFQDSVTSLQTQIGEWVTFKKDAGRLLSMNPYEIHSMTPPQLLKKIEGSISRVEMSPELIKQLYASRSALDEVIKKAEAKQ
jgi:hypothetical protein